MIFDVNLITITLYIIGVLANMRMYWVMDQKSLQKSGWTLGFTRSLFMSIILGMFVGNIYIY